MTPKVVWTPELTAKLYELWDDTTLTRQDIADRLGVTLERMGDKARYQMLPSDKRPKPVFHDRWTTDRIDILRNMWEKGVTAREIATTLGPQFNRMAVIGKAHRMNLAKRRKTPGTMTQQDHENAEMRRRELRSASERFFVMRKEKAPQPAPVPPPATFLHVQLSDLEDNQCRWPFGEDEIAYCGQRVDYRHSYCAHHRNEAKGVKTRPYPVRPASRFTAS